MAPFLVIDGVKSIQGLRLSPSQHNQNQHDQSHNPIWSWFVRSLTNDKNKKKDAVFLIHFRVSWYAAYAIFPTMWSYNQPYYSLLNFPSRAIFSDVEVLKKFLTSPTINCVCPLLFWWIIVEYTRFNRLAKFQSYLLKKEWQWGKQKLIKKKKKTKSWSSLSKTLQRKTSPP